MDEIKYIFVFLPVDASLVKQKMIVLWLINGGGRHDVYFPAYMGITCSPLPQNNGNLPLPFCGGNYPIVLLYNIY